MPTQRGDQEGYPVSLDIAIKLLHDNYSNKDISIASLYYQLVDLAPPTNRPDFLQIFRLEVESLVKTLSIKVVSQTRHPKETP